MLFALHCTSETLIAVPLVYTFIQIFSHTEVINQIKYVLGNLIE